MSRVLSDVLRFEFGYHLRRPSFWLVAVVFGAFGFADLVSKASAGNAYFYVNSPSQIFQTTVWYCLFSVLAATAFVAETFVRDVRCGMEPLVLATPVSKRDYLGLRFLAAFLVTVLAVSFYVPGMLLASFMPGLNPYAMGPLRLDAFALSYALVAVPDLLLVSVFAFVLASRFRSMIATYVGAIGLVMLYIGAMLMVGVEQIDYTLLQWWSLFDPYGYFALEATTLAWTVHQHNHELPELGGVFLQNRFLWMSVAMVGWWLAYRKFDMRPDVSRSLSRKQSIENVAADVGRLPQKTAMGSGQLFLLRSLGWQQLPQLTGFELGFILRSRAFQLLMFCGLASLLFAASGSRSFEHSNPSTDILIHTASLYFDYVLFAIVVFYAAELMWREQDHGIKGVIDAMPVPGWLRVMSKLLALFAVVSLNLLLCMAVVALYQVVNGYYQFEFGLSALMLFGVQGPYFYCVAVLALFCQALTRHKYGGMLLTLLVALLPIPLDAFGLYHNLYRFGATNDLGYSPMNGFGALLKGHWWFAGYWAAVCAVLVMLTVACWPRGEGARRFALRQQPVGAQFALAFSTMASALLASWIFYNTTVLNAYQPPGKDLLAVAHESRYKQFENLPMPVVVSTKLKADLYPDERYFLSKGQYVLENRTDRPIEEIHLSTFINLKLVKAEMPGARLVKSDTDTGYYIYRLDSPMTPGERATLTFVTRTEKPQGFRNESDADDVYMIAPNDVVGNGTSLYSPFILPFIGYTKMVEHKEAWLRHKHGLPPLDQRMRPHDDSVGLSRALTVSHLAWGETDVTVGTSADQMAVSSGREMKRWQQGDRNYVRYQSGQNSRGKFTLYSARYEVKRDERGRVPVEAFYHRLHEGNVAPMLGHLVVAMDVYEKAFGPYPFEQLRLAEFAYYPGMVFSEGGMIGLPEVLVWKADLNGDGEDAMVGWLSYLLAHVWWEDQVMAADVAGGMSIRESLSGYASNLYRREIYSTERFNRIKQRQMRDYFRALGQVDFAEPPLDDVYNEVLPARFKGQMVLEQIESRIGKPALLAGIREFLKKFRYRPAPYATLPDLESAILAYTPDNLRDRVAELFDQVVTYQFGVREAFSTSQNDGQYQATLMIEARKLYTHDLGEQAGALMDWPLAVVIEDAIGNVLYSGDLQFTSENQTFNLTLPAQPYRVKLDPMLSLPTAHSPLRERVIVERHS